MASLQARHQRNCAGGRPWTTFAEATKKAGCTCTPLYHVVLRHDGKLVREPVGHNQRYSLRQHVFAQFDELGREFDFVGSPQ